MIAACINRPKREAQPRSPSCRCSPQYHYLVAVPASPARQRHRPRSHRTICSAEFPAVVPVLVCRSCHNVGRRGLRLILPVGARCFDRDTGKTRPAWDFVDEPGGPGPAPDVLPVIPSADGGALPAESRHGHVCDHPALVSRTYGRPASGTGPPRKPAGQEEAPTGRDTRQPRLSEKAGVFPWLLM